MPDKSPILKAITPEAAMLAANKHILFHYPTLFTGTAAHRLRLLAADVWMVPIILTHPEHGILGEVGLVAVDATTGQVLGSTPRRDVVAAGKRLREAKDYDRTTALLPPRAV